MAVERVTLKTFLDNFTFFENSSVFYFTAILRETIYSEKNVVLPKGSICQLKFDKSIENFCPKRILSARAVTFETDFVTEVCFIKQNTTLRFSPDKILDYEDRNGDTC